VKSENIVFIHALTSDPTPVVSEVFDLSISSWKSFAAKHDCRVVVLDEPILHTDMSLVWHKYYAFDMLDAAGVEYDQVLIIEADTIVNPECPNFFEFTGHNYSAVPDCVRYDEVIQGEECYKAHLFPDCELDIWGHVNGGFQIFNKTHKKYVEEFMKFYIDNRKSIDQLDREIGITPDQMLMNFLLRRNKVDVTLLPYEFNMTSLHVSEGLSDELPFVELGYVYRFNEIPNSPQSALHWMQRVTDKIFHHVTCST
jgi:hypothetical protein